VIRVPGEGAYRLLLWLHPRSFRRRYADELVACFREGWRDEVEGAGVAAALAFWWRMISGTISTAWRQRVLSAQTPAGPQMRRRTALERFGAGLGNAWQDARFALRTLRRTPGFAAAVLATLGMGIGAATAVFTIVDGILLRPLPYPQPDRLYAVSQDGEDGSYWLSAPNYHDLKRDLKGVLAMGAYTPDGANVVVDGEPARLSVAEADADFFRTLGVEPALGRTFTEEERTSGAAVAVVSHGMWRQRFGGRPDAMGATVLLDGTARTVIGVMPAGTMVPAGVDVWTPLNMDRPEWRTRRGISWIQVLARLDPGVDVSVVRSGAATLSATLRSAFPQENRSFEIGLRSLEDVTVGPMRTQLRTLMAAVALMLLVTAINVGGLMLARATVRSDEFAVRVALGGGPRRLMAQVFTENVVLAALGVTLGIVIGRIGVAVLVTAAPPRTPRLGEVALGSNGLLFAAGAGVLAALMFGLVPALTAFRRPAGAIRASRSGRTRAATRLRDALVVSQVALALALLFGAGLLAKSFWQMQQVDLGFEPEGVLVAGLPIDDSEFASADAREAHYNTLLERAAALPGVRDAALTSAAPFDGFGVVFNYELPDVPEATGAEKLSRLRIVTSDVFATLGIRIERGRTFSHGATVRGGPMEAVVSEELTRKWFSNRDPLDARIVTAGDTFRIVGIVGSIRDVSPRTESPFPHVYVPVMPSTRQSMTLVLRTSGDPAAFIDPLRRVVRETASTQPVTPLRPLSRLVADSAARDRFTLELLAFFAVAALLMAGVGLYGVLAYTVSRRTREIGVRVALGAPLTRVRGLIVRRGMGLAALGLLAGTLLAAWGGRFLEGMLFEVESRDPYVLTIVLTTLLGVALLAAWIPARRATRIPPIEALRVE